ncbi:LRR receptor-like serine/threonine-protein kinase GHR1 isoform X2 [Panicum virgatum]|nr:LRR receptor-like serine/threonine-protein kinase GHR1 isoform X2 [Panicum virgatum]KAG2605112.1 hypothetical protein PVAP13_4NG117500 [Panicum virgatum]
MSNRIPWERFFLLSHVLCVLISNIHHASHGCSVEERAALMEIRSSLVRAGTAVPDSWGRGGDCCSWERVNCSGSGGTRRVSHLDLSNLYYGGHYWSFNMTVFSAFSELQFLDLSSNHPSSLGSDGLVVLLNLTKLQQLNLSGNYWLEDSSILAPIGELVSLQVLDLNFNQMRNLPVAAFGNLTNMRELFLSHNEFDGSLPKTLLVLPHLKILDLSGNSFDGGIPISLSSVEEPASLEVLNLNYNLMSGDLPTEQEFRYLRNIRELRLSFNQFSGNLSAFLFSLPHFKILDLSWNSLVEGIPISPSSDEEPASVEVLNLSNNKMSGALPTEQEFRYLRNIRELDLSLNQFSGNLSAFLFSLPHIEQLDLSGNLFEGPIPISLSSNLSLSLKSLRFSQNNLSGKLSFYWLRNLTKLEEIDLSENTNLVVHVNIPGWVPPFQLKRLALSGCDLDRAIIKEPHFLRTQLHLEELDLSNNNLSGSMPNWLFRKEATLVDLSLGNNSLSGSLDPTGHPQTALQSMIISNNHITGQLPVGFGSMFPCLSTLAFSDNNFYGQIPMSLCHINRMRLLDLSNNHFSGELPACVFTDFPDMQIFSISNNQLEGTLPRLLSGSLVIMSLYDNKLFGNQEA